MKKIMMMAAMLAMMALAAVPALAQDATIEGDGDDGDVTISRTFLSAGDGSQVALNDCEQSLDQTVYQYNSPEVNIDGDDNEVARGGTSVSAEQAQYSFGLLFGGFDDADFDDSFDYLIAFRDFDNDGVDDEVGN